MYHRYHQENELVLGRWDFQEVFQDRLNDPDMLQAKDMKNEQIIFFLNRV